MTPGHRPPRAQTLVLSALVVGLTLLASHQTGSAQPKKVDDRHATLGPWPADVADFVPPKPGEHPRLLFRKTDLEAIRKRAQTPEGQAMVSRLRRQLNGSDGESMPKVGGAPAKGDDEGGAAGVYSISHVAGFGMLYQITGEKKYADLGRKCMELAMEGTPNFDPRYSFKNPNGALRAGPSLGWTAVGYDLCYDGWDEDFRQQVAKAIAEYSPAKGLKNQSDMDLAGLVKGNRQHPGSNHWGMIVGGGALAVLAIKDDPGVDMAKIAPLLEASQTSIKIQCTQGFGSGGVYVEGDGTGSMASHIALLPAIQAWRVAGGKDFYAPRPYAQWMNLKWFFLTGLGGDPKNLRASFPERGDYPHNIWARGGLSGANYFGIGFGVATEDQRAAMLWFYDRAGLREWDAKHDGGVDAPSPYPHHSVLSLANWPVGLAERDPDDVLPHAYTDDVAGFYAWRNRWQDKDDVIASILTRSVKGNMGMKGETTLTIQHGGKKTKWGRIGGGFKDEFKPAKDGSTVMMTGEGGCLAIDFSRASGADAMLVLSGPAATGAKDAVDVGGTPVAFLFLGGGKAPVPTAEGNKLSVGDQTVALDGKRIVLGR
ncbi:MAG TPA: hypothetical protein VEA69_15045 [Tepidisphaeraceae bacterium]|nr:hypothetical protein [Tepidisphaeraceae bacterium]